MPIRLAVFDFDLTLSVQHVFGALAGASRHTKEADTPSGAGNRWTVPPPHARTEHGQLIRIAELDASPEFQARGGFAVAAFGGHERIAGLLALLAELRAAGVECLVCTRGLIGPVRRCLDQVGLLPHFTQIYGKVRTFYGVTEYDVQVSAASLGADSRYLGSSKVAEWDSKPEVITQCLQERGLQGHEAMFIDDDLSEVQAAMAVCNTMHVQGGQGLSNHDFAILRNTIAGSQGGSPASAPFATTPLRPALQQPQSPLLLGPSRSANSGQEARTLALPTAYGMAHGSQLQPVAYIPAVVQTQAPAGQPSHPLVLTASCSPAAAWQPAKHAAVPVQESPPSYRLRWLHDPRCPAPGDVANPTAQSEELDAQLAAVEVRVAEALRPSKEGVNVEMLTDLLKGVDALQDENQSLWWRQEEALKGLRRTASNVGPPRGIAPTGSQTRPETSGSRTTEIGLQSKAFTTSTERLRLMTELTTLHELVQERELLDLEATCGSIVQHRTMKELAQSSVEALRKELDKGVAKAAEDPMKGWHLRQLQRQEEAAAAAGAAYGVLFEAERRELELAEQLRALEEEQVELENLSAWIRAGAAAVNAQQDVLEQQWGPPWPGDLSAYAQSV